MFYGHVLTNDRAAEYGGPRDPTCGNRVWVYLPYDLPS
jgi:hypothetical protein